MSHWRSKFRHLTNDFCCKAEGERIIKEVETRFGKKGTAEQKYDAAVKLFVPIRDMVLDHWNIICAS